MRRSIQGSSSFGFAECSGRRVFGAFKETVREARVYFEEDSKGGREWFSFLPGSDVLSCVEDSTEWKKGVPQSLLLVHRRKISFKITHEKDFPKKMADSRLVSVDREASGWPLGADSRVIPCIVWTDELAHAPIASQKLLRLNQSAFVQVQMRSDMRKHSSCSDDPRVGSDITVLLYRMRLFGTHNISRKTAKIIRPPVHSTTSHDIIVPPTPKGGRHVSQAAC